MKTYLFLGLCAFHFSLFACGPQIPDYHYRFVESVAAGPAQQFAAFGLRWDEILPNYDQFLGNAMERENIQEWIAKFCNAPDSAEVRDLVYTSSLDDISSLLDAVSNNQSMPARFNGNMLAEMMANEKCTETVMYLHFAKRCEPFVTANFDAWNEAPNLDTLQMRNLQREALAVIPQTVSHWVRLRYVYQCIRLTHYLGDAKETVRLYEYLMPRTDTRVKSCVRLWIKAHYAGALQELNRLGESAVNFAHVFANSPGKRKEAWQSCYIPNTTVWQEAMALANKDEKVALFGIRALMRDSRPLADMDSIFRLAPKHPLLDVLLLRELQRLEEKRLGANFKNPWDPAQQASFDRAKKAEADYLNRLLVVVSAKLNTDKLNSPLLWKFGKAYLTFLAGDFQTAQKELLQLTPQIETTINKRDGSDTKNWSGLARQADLLQLLLDINATNSVKSQRNTLDIGESHKLLPYFPDLPRYTRDALSTQLLQSDRPGMAVLAKYGMQPFYYNPHQPLMRELLLLQFKSDELTGFDRRLLAIDNTPSLDIMLDVQGAFLLGRGRFEEALTVFNRITPAYWSSDKSIFNPFRDTLQECINCSYPDLDAARYNRLQITVVLDSLTRFALSNPTASAAAYYRLGLACQNMSYFGSEWQTADYFRSSTTWNYLNEGELNRHGEIHQPLGNWENTQKLTELALSYFDLSRLHFQDKEWQARATFRAAMCEQNLYFIQTGYTPDYSNRIPQAGPAYQRYNQLLKNFYSNTVTYQNALRTCSYFRLYAAR